MTDPLVEIDNLGLTIGGQPVLRGVSLSVATGESLGLVGESGSGKSMTLRCLTRLLPPGAKATGEVRLAGTDVLGLRERQLRAHRQSIGMVFQDPRTAINPLHTVGSYMVERAKDSGAGLRDATDRALDVLQAMGISDPQRRMDQYPFELSGGLLQRVMIASVVMEQPRLILADEPTTALDVTTQAEVLRLLDGLREKNSAAMIFVTHDLDLAAAVCDRIAVMYGGRILEVGPATTLPDAAVHPYTRALLAARPPLTHRLETIPTVPGVPASAARTGDGCPFAARCPVALPVCSETLPGMETVGSSQVRCHRASEVQSGALDAELPLRLELQ